MYSRQLKCRSALRLASVGATLGGLVELVNVGECLYWWCLVVSILSLSAEVVKPVSTRKVPKVRQGRS